MFPQITKKKKKNSIGHQLLIKQWEETSRQLDAKAKIALKKLPIQIVSDFNKVCKLKSIPQFYSNYFLHSTQKISEETLSQVFKKEIENIMGNKSYFHIINQILKNREELIQNIKSSIHIVEGFIMMNQGKNIPTAIKGRIDEIVKDCQNLQQLKQIQQQKAIQLAHYLIQIRKNTLELIYAITYWRQYLLNMPGADQPSIWKFKVIYPHQAINCLLITLFDTSFIKNSFLKKQIQFQKQENDPFLSKIFSTRRTSEIQNHLLSKLDEDKCDYQKYTQFILNEISFQKKQPQKLIHKEPSAQRIQSHKIIRQSSKKKFKKDQIEDKKDVHTYKYEDTHKRNLNILAINESQLKNQILNSDLDESQYNSPSNDRIIQAYHRKFTRESKEKNLQQMLDNSIIQLDNDNKSLQNNLQQQKKIKSKINQLIHQVNQKQHSINPKQSSNASIYQLKLKQYQQEVLLLKSKIHQRNNKNPPSGGYTARNQTTPKKRSSILSVYSSNLQQKIKPQALNELESKLDEQQSNRRSLQLQIQELTKEKLKLQKLLDTKEEEISKRKLEKYDQMLNKLKNESKTNKKLIKDLANSKYQDQDSDPKKSNSNLRIHTHGQAQDEKSQKLNHRMDSKQKKKKLKPNESFSLSEKSFTSSKKEKKDIEIISNKKTIEIVFDGINKKKKSESNFERKSKDREQQSQAKVQKLQKQKELLQKKLDIASIVKYDNNILLNRKVSKKDSEIQKYIQKEQTKNPYISKNIQLIRKNLNDEYEIKLNIERIKFEKEKEDLLKKIEIQKRSKHQKQKHLQDQMKFLKDMQRNQNELVRLFEHEKRQRKQKEKLLQQELNKKKSLLGYIEVQKIKKDIQIVVREQLQQNYKNNDIELYDIDIDQQKLKLEKQIQYMILEGGQQLKEIDDHNQILKLLIDKIKNQQNKILDSIQENIDQQQITQQDRTEFQKHMKNRLKTQQRQKPKQIYDYQGTYTQELSPVNQYKPDFESIKQLEFKTERVYEMQKNRRQKYKQIKNTKHYQQKQQIQNIIQFYLDNSPKDNNNDYDYTQQEKNVIVNKLIDHNKKAIEFERQLFSTHQVKKYTLTDKSNSITDHLLNLRQAYQDYEAQSLRRELFPPITQEQIYNTKQLSVQTSQAPPPITRIDQAKIHVKKIETRKRSASSKNFLAINKMKVLELQQTKKQKQRLMIEEQTKRRVRRNTFDVSKRKDRMQKQKQKKNEQQKQLHITNTFDRSKIKTSHQNVRSKRQKSLSEKQISFTEIEKQKPQSESEQKQQSIRRSTQKKEQEVKITPIDEQQIENSIDNEMQIIYKPQRQMIHKKQKKQGIRKKQEHQETNKKQKQQLMDTKQKLQTIHTEQKEQRIHTQYIDIEREKEQKFEKQRQELIQDIKQYQQEIRSYISSEQQFKVYQQFISQDKIANYFKQILNLSSQQIQKLNSHLNIFNDAEEYCSVNIVIAKDKNNTEVGIGIFHKQYEGGQYICDYLLSHNMQNFLNLTFNFSKYVFKNDPVAQKIQFLFNLDQVQDQFTLMHFSQFEAKCKRLGEVYVKVNSTKQRKYVLRRNLFENIQNVMQVIQKPIQFCIKAQIHDQLLKQKNIGFINDKNINYLSSTAIMAYFLKKNSDKLATFRSTAQEDLKFRELLLTALLFEKKQLEIKNISASTLQKNDNIPLMKSLEKMFYIKDTQWNVQEMQFHLVQKLPSKIKRCILEVDNEQINYLMYTPQQAITRIQSSNSSETGLFLGIIPKYKIMIIEADQFLTMSKNNPDLTAFFYIKHFIKNICDVKKQNYNRVFLPEICIDDDAYLQELSSKMRGSVFLKEKIRIGWNNPISSSILYEPKHKDLVIQKPFIFALLSGNIQRAVQGTPICVNLIS